MENLIRICLDATLEKLKVSRYELSKRTEIQYQIIDNYYKNKVKRYELRFSAPLHAFAHRQHVYELFKNG